MPVPKLPETKPFRVVVVGVSYNEPTHALHPETGEDIVVHAGKVGVHGEEIQLTEVQARRLEELGAVKAKGAPLGYEEQDVEALKALAKERGLDVKGSGANGGVVKDDLIQALNTYDAGALGS